jgi:hypothetical protein
MREYMSSSPTHSPPHRDTPLADADSAASGGNRYLSGASTPTCALRKRYDAIMQNFFSSAHCVVYLRANFILN